MGMPREGVDPIEPPHGSFTYSEKDLLPSIYCGIHDDLAPPAPATPPHNRSFPLSPTWKYTEDHRYQTRFVYSAPYYLVEKENHRKQLMVIDTPPHIIPSQVDGQFIINKVPGMVQMIPGIPFVYHVDNDSNAMHTVACLHTLESLRPYPCFSKVLELSVQLSKLTWGCQAHDTTPKIMRISHLPGLKHNHRSKNIAADGTSSSDGSYSLANTVLEGEGQGTILPAVQVNTQEARAQITSVLRCLNQLYRLVMPLCLSKFEFEISDFHSEINNVMSFGGLMPNGTSCQMNSSSLGKNLEMIGKQGSWHTDSKDDPTRSTLFVLLLLVGPSEYPNI